MGFYFKHINIKNFICALTRKSMDDYDANWFNYYFDGNPNNNFQQKAYAISKILDLGQIDDNEIERIVALLNEANELKNRGFYVDYENDWLTPENIGEQTFKSYLNIDTILMRFVKPLFTTSLTDNDELIELIYGK